jgi:predicted enzyme involved in methoxymalonyl-ACP biosynthesis
MQNGNSQLPPDSLLIDTWLMSCRVLGRQVEPTTLNLVAEQAKLLGAKHVVGQYRPTKKNGMVRDHFARLGFVTGPEDSEGGTSSVLALADFTPADTFIDVKEG